MHQQLANATFQVIAGDSCGSGFSFMREELVVTNLHVVKSCINQQGTEQIKDIILKTELNEQIYAQILDINDIFDFAVLQVLSPLPKGRHILQPFSDFNPIRGRKIIFAGYPHGIPQLLTNEGIISAPIGNGMFTLDGMVNGGNSGGPIIDALTGEAIGIVTQRRYFLGEQAKGINDEATKIRSELEDFAKRVQFSIGGINFAEFADMSARSLQIVTKMLEMNANTGIGIGFPLAPVIETINL